MKLSVKTLLSLSLVSFILCSCQDNVSNLKGWIGKSEADVLKPFPDKPHYETHYMASEAIGEIRVSVLDQYPPEDPGSKFVEIKEAWWQRDDYTFTFIFHKPTGKWKVYDAFKWHKDIV